MTSFFVRAGGQAALRPELRFQSQDSLAQDSSGPLLTQVKMKHFNTKRPVFFWTSSIVFGAVLYGIGEHYRWVEYCRCYLLIVASSCGVIVLVSDQGPHWRQQTRLYRLGLMLILLGLGIASPAYFLRALALAGGAGARSLSDIGVPVSAGLILMGAAVSYWAWKTAQDKYQREYALWRQERDEWERQNPDWERQQRIYEWNFGRPISEELPPNAKN